MAKGTKEDPWDLLTPPGTSKYTMYIDDENNKIVCQVGSTTLFYDKTAIEDLHSWLKKKGDWVELGGADEQKPAKEGSVEEFGRTKGPNDGWFGLKKGLRGRFGVYMPPLLEAMGMAELTHEKRDNKMKAK